MFVMLSNRNANQMLDFHASLSYRLRYGDEILVLYVKSRDGILYESPYPPQLSL